MTPLDQLLRMRPLAGSWAPKLPGPGAALTAVGLDSFPGVRQSRDFTCWAVACAALRRRYGHTVNIDEQSFAEGYWRDSGSPEALGKTTPGWNYPATDLGSVLRFAALFVRLIPVVQVEDVVAGLGRSNVVLSILAAQGLGHVCVIWFAWERAKDDWVFNVFDPRPGTSSIDTDPATYLGRSGAEAGKTPFA
jgi:hypothetical protein